MTAAFQAAAGSHRRAGRTHFALAQTQAPHPLPQRPPAPPPARPVTARYQERMAQRQAALKENSS
jgi:hypothetical protein